MGASSNATTRPGCSVNNCSVFRTGGPTVTRSSEVAAPAPRSLLRCIHLFRAASRQRTECTSKHQRLQCNWLHQSNSWIHDRTHLSLQSNGSRDHLGPSTPTRDLLWIATSQRTAEERNSVANVAAIKPPTTARPSGAFCCPDSPSANAIGIIPAIIAKLVIKIARNRLPAPVTAASFTLLTSASSLFSKSNQ